MPWPVDDLSTAGVDSGTDRPPRAEFFKLFQRVKTVIAGRGTQDGVASLDGRRRVPDAELGRGVAGGVAALDASGRVPDAQLPPQPEPAQQVPTGTILAFAGVRPSGMAGLPGRRRQPRDLSRALRRHRHPLRPRRRRHHLQPAGPPGPLPLRRRRRCRRGQHRRRGRAHPYGGRNARPRPRARRRAPGRRQPAHRATSSSAPPATVDVIPSNDTYGVRASGGGQPHNNVPPYVEINYIVRT